MAAVMSLLALSGAARGALGPRYGGDAAIGVREMPPSIEPGAAAGLTASRLGGLVHETLVGVDAEGRPAPALVRAWAAAADGREWRLDLAEGLLFHDGRPVTSEEALTAVRRFLRTDSPAAAWLAAGLDKEAPASAPDPLHLVLRFAEPRALPLAPLAAPAAAVTGARGAGCGPFVPLAPAPGKRIRLSAFRGHVRGRPYLDAVDVAALGAADLETRYWAGTLDVVATKEGVSALAATLLLVLDPKHPPFDGREARATVAGALDRADIVRRLLPGGDAAPSLLVPGLLPPMVAHAPARGEALRSAVRMAVGSDVPALVSQRIIASLGAVGLRVEAQAVAPAQARTASAAMRLVLWTPEVAEAGLALHELARLAPRAPGAFEALAEAGRELDHDRRRALLHRAQAALLDENVLIPVAAVPVSFGVRPGLHGLRIDLSGRLILEDAWREP